MTAAQARARFVAQAQQYIGIRENSGAHKEIIQIYNSIRPLPRGFQMNTSLPWCAAFVSAVAQQCGMTDIVPPECSCWYMMSGFQRLGEWTERDDYVPSAGDVVFYDWQDSGAGDSLGVPDHVGIVEQCYGSRIVVIEGNYGDSVARRYLTVGAQYIRGYGLPNYAHWAKEHGSAGKPTGEGYRMTMLSKGSRGYQVKVAQSLLILNGCSCGRYGADGVFGSATLSAVKKYQKAKGLAVDGIVGPNTWNALLGL